MLPIQTVAPTSWQFATVEAVRRETPSASTFRLRPDEVVPHVAGQHYIVRLTAPDGYHAQRSYSVASPPGGDVIELTVEHLPGGEVSGFLCEEVEAGDRLEIRGPIGGFFIWDATKPALGVGGGSGLVPLMSMFRHARALGQPDSMRLVASVRTHDDLYYASELTGPESLVVYSRTAPSGTARPAGRLNPGDLTAIDGLAEREIYVCGSPGFCDGASATLAEAGVDPLRIRVDRFGPTG